MEVEFLIALHSSTVVLMLFSIWLDVHARRFGFDPHRLLEYRVECEYRQRTEIGKLATKPLLIQHHESQFVRIGCLLTPILLNGGLLAWLYWTAQYNLIPLITVPLMIAEFLLVWWVGRRALSLYQPNLELYLRLTEDRNQTVVVTLKDYLFALQPDELAMVRLLTGGRLITAIVAAQVGRPAYQLKLFLPSETRIPEEVFASAASMEAVRIFYQPVPFVQGNRVDGVFLGFQPIPPEPDPLRAPSADEYKRRLAKGAN